MSDLSIPQHERYDLAVGDRVEIDPQLGTGRIVAWVDADTIDATIPQDEAWVIVALDDGLWAWKGHSTRAEGTQASAYISQLVVSVSNLTLLATV